MISRQSLSQSRRWVVKIGSALLTDDGRGLNGEAINRWVGQLAQLKREGIEIILVSSGAVAEGMSRLGWSQRPSALHEQQAAAADRMGPIKGHSEAPLERLIASSRRHHEPVSRHPRYPSWTESTDQESIAIGSLLASNHPEAKRRKF